VEVALDAVERLSGGVVLGLADVKVGGGAVGAHQVVAAHGGVLAQQQAPPVALDVRLLLAGAGTLMAAVRRHRTPAVRPDPQQTWVQTACPKTLVCKISH
jgi:hypothetical protein